MSKKRAYAAYDKDGVCIAVADSVSELASMVHKQVSTITKGIKNGSPLYAYIMTDEELAEYEKKK